MIFNCFEQVKKSVKSSEEASMSAMEKETIEKEQLENGNSETPCEVTPVLEKIDDSKNDKGCEPSDSIKMCDDDDDDDVVIISEVISKNDNIEGMDVELIVIDEKKTEGVSVEVENNLNAGTRNENENPQATVSKKNEEVHASKNTGKVRVEIDFISNDAKENKDNSDEKWDSLRSLSKNGDKYSFIRKRWGNSALPDPSIDLTYRHRFKRIQSKERGRQKKKASKRVKNARSLSCVSHLEKLMNDVKTNYYSELKKLCERHCLIMSDMQSRYQSEFATLMQYSLHSRNFIPETAQMLLLRQRQDAMLQDEKYQKEIQNLTNKTSSSLARYEKYSEEMLTFHKQYQIDGNGMLKTEQFLHLQDTERMYEEYNKFYC